MKNSFRPKVCCVTILPLIIIQTPESRPNNISLTFISENDDDIRVLYPDDKSVKKLIILKILAKVFFRFISCLIRY